MFSHLADLSSTMCRDPIVVSLKFPSDLMPFNKREILKFFKNYALVHHSLIVTMTLCCNNDAILRSLEKGGGGQLRPQNCVHD